MFNETLSYTSYEEIKSIGTFGVTKVTPDTILFIETMKNFMYSQNATGVSANEVGYPLRLIVMHLFTPGPTSYNPGEHKKTGSSAAFLNPSIVDKKAPLKTTIASKMFPSKRFPVEVYSIITVKYANVTTGEYTTVNLQGVNAINFQVQMNILDLVTPVDSLPEEEKQEYLESLNP